MAKKETPKAPESEEITPPVQTEEKVETPEAPQPDPGAGKSEDQKEADQESAEILKGTPFKSLKALRDGFTNSNRENVKYESAFKKMVELAERNPIIKKELGAELGLPADETPPPVDNSGQPVVVPTSEDPEDEKRKQFVDEQREKVSREERAQIQEFLQEHKGQYLAENGSDVKQDVWDETGIYLPAVYQAATRRGEDISVKEALNRAHKIAHGGSQEMNTPNPQNQPTEPTPQENAAETIADQGAQGTGASGNVPAGKPIKLTEEEHFIRQKFRMSPERYAHGKELTKGPIVLDMGVKDEE